MRVRVSLVLRDFGDFWSYGLVFMIFKKNLTKLKMYATRLTFMQFYCIFFCKFILYMSESENPKVRKSSQESGGRGNPDFKITVQGTFDSIVINIICKVCAERGLPGGCPSCASDNDPDDEEDL